MPKLLTFAELRNHGIIYGRRHVDNLERMGKFPRRVPIGANRVGWIEAEISRYVKDRIAARSTAAGALGSTGRALGKRQAAL